MAKTETKKAKGQELATKSDIDNMKVLSFDSIYNMDEKEIAKKVSYDQKKTGKRS